MKAKTVRVKAAGAHHPYCKETYEDRGDYWACVCDVLKAYDEWKRPKPKAGKKK